MSFFFIIKIDESLNNHHFLNNRSILNMWPRSSQKSGLQINGYWIRSSHSPNPPQNYGCGYGHEFSWTLVTKKCNNNGCQFSCMVVTKKRILSTTIITKKKHISFLEGLLPTNVGFLGHLSLRRQRVMGASFLGGS